MRPTRPTFDDWPRIDAETASLAPKVRPRVPARKRAQKAPRASQGRAGAFPRIPEKVVQAQCVALLRRLGARVWVLGTVRAKGDFPGTRQTPGISDVIAFLRGACLFLECKAAGGTLRPEQADFREAALTCGAPVYHVVGGVDELFAWLVERGIVKADNVPHARRGGSER